MTNYMKRSLDRVEFGSKLHKCMDLEIVPRANVHREVAMYPISQRDQPQAAELFSAASFAMFARGSGTAGTAPPDDALLLACGMSSTTVALTSVTYALTAGLTHTATNIDCYKGNRYLTSVDNAVGNLEIVGEPGAPCRYLYSFAGTYVLPTSASGTAAAATQAATAPICKGATCTLGTATLVVKRFGINFGNVFPEYDPDIASTNGVVNPELSDRDVTYSMTVRLEDPATNDWWTKLTAKTKTALSIVLGATAGNIITIAADGYLMEQPAYDESEGFHEVTLNCAMSYVAGDAALTIAYT